MSLSDKIHDCINEWFDSIIYPTNPAGLYEPVEYTLRAGGKRIRPTLLLAAVHAFGGNIDEARDQCLGIEMFHNFTLLHDDVMDNSDVRRGQPTVHRKWSANTAILSGDTMLTMATQLVCNCADRHLRAVLDTFNTTAIEVYEGQQLDMDFEDREDVTVDEYLEMIRLKTSVLLGCALKIGSIIADADIQAAEALYRYGINLGLGFQLRDDYLDTFGDPLIFGKQIGGDILNDKKTWLMINAVNEDNTMTMQKALEGRYSDSEKVVKVTEVYKALRLDERILDLIKHYSDEAVRALDDVDMDTESRDYFVHLAKTLVDRMN